MGHQNEFTGKYVLQLQHAIKERHKQLTDSNSLIERKKAELSEVQAEIHHLMLENSAIRSHIDMLERLLRQAEEEVFAEDCILEVMEPQNETYKSLKRNPMEMIKPQFKGMQLGDIVELILEQHRTSLTTTEISRIIYDTGDKEEFTRARNSLSAELRSGASRNPPRWLKKGRSAYVALSQLGVGQVLSSSNGGAAHAG